MADIDMDILTDEEKKKISHLVRDDAFEGSTGLWLRFWSNNTVQIDGDMDLAGLKNLVKIMEALRG